MQKALLLLSGGIDSPVALHLVKKFMPVEVVHFHYEPITDRASVDKSWTIAQKFGVKKMYLYPLAPAQAEILKYCDSKYFFILSKRLMMRVSEHLAHRVGATCLVTGESVGQVASQTLQNLYVIAQSVKIPLYRPVLTHNKPEIIKIAQDIGTFDLSKGPEICNILGPRHPSTNTPLHRILSEEEKIDLPRIVTEMIAKEEILTAK